MHDRSTLRVSLILFACTLLTTQHLQAEKYGVATTSVGRRQYDVYSGSPGSVVPYKRDHFLVGGLNVGGDLAVVSYEEDVTIAAAAVRQEVSSSTTGMRAFGEVSLCPKDWLGIGAKVGFAAEKLSENLYRSSDNPIYNNTQGKRVNRATGLNMIAIAGIRPIDQLGFGIKAKVAREKDKRSTKLPGDTTVDTSYTNTYVVDFGLVVEPIDLLQIGIEFAPLSMTQTSAANTKGQMMGKLGVGLYPGDVFSVGLELGGTLPRNTNWDDRVEKRPIGPAFSAYMALRPADFVGISMGGTISDEKLITQYEAGGETIDFTRRLFGRFGVDLYPVDRLCVTIGLLGGWSKMQITEFGEYTSRTPVTAGGRLAIMLSI